MLRIVGRPVPVFTGYTKSIETGAKQIKTWRITRGKVGAAGGTGSTGGGGSGRWSQYRAGRRRVRGFSISRLLELDGGGNGGIKECGSLEDVSCSKGSW